MRPCSREAKVSPDGPGLLAFFRDRSLNDTDRQHLDALVGQLGSDAFDQREKASAALVTRGPLAVPFLRRALASADAEVVRRARAGLEQIDSGPGPALPGAAVRLLALRKPAGAVEVLLRYAPHADDVGVEDEVAAALAALGLRNGKVPPALLAALSDREPARRAVAVAVVGRATDPARRSAARRLLGDPDADVRFRAAWAALAARDRAGLATLVKSSDRRSRMDRSRRGGALPPGRRAGAADGAGREAGGRLATLAARTGGGGRPRPAGVGRPLLRLHPRRRAQRRRRLGMRPRGKVHWQVTGLARPHDARRLPNGHVLVCEHAGSRVCERNIPGSGRGLIPSRSS